MTIEIDGKEYEVLDISDDRREIYTGEGITFCLTPICFGHTGSFGKSIPPKELPKSIPDYICKRTFAVPDLTEQYPDEVKADYEADIQSRKAALKDGQYAGYKKQCKLDGGMPESFKKFADRWEHSMFRGPQANASFDAFKKTNAIEILWHRHGVGRMENQYGFADNSFVFLLENQGHDPDQIQYEVGYPGGEIVYLSALDQHPFVPPESLRPRETNQNQKPLPDGSEPVNQQQAAEYLSVSESTVRRWQKDGLIRVYKVKRACRYYKKELDEDVQKHGLKK